jgi:hypothetical protein
VGASPPRHPPRARDHLNSLARDKLISRRLASVMPVGPMPRLFGAKMYLFSERRDNSYLTHSINSTSFYRVMSPAAPLHKRQDLTGTLHRRQGLTGALHSRQDLTDASARCATTTPTLSQRRHHNAGSPHRHLLEAKTSPI